MLLFAEAEDFWPVLGPRNRGDNGGEEAPSVDSQDDETEGADTAPTELASASDEVEDDVEVDETVASDEVDDDDAVDGGSDDAAAAADEDDVDDA